MLKLKAVHLDSRHTLYSLEEGIRIVQRRPGCKDRVIELDADGVKALRLALVQLEREERGGWDTD
jgi:hypothetical protein